MNDPDNKEIGGDPHLGRLPGEHGNTVSSHGSRISREIGDIQVKEWEMNHGFVDDAVPNKDALVGPYAWKRAQVINTDVAIREKMNPYDYAKAKARASQDDADMIGPLKYVDSTVPSDSDPAGIAAAPFFNPGDPRVAMQALYKDRKFRGEFDPEAGEIMKRNKKLPIPMNLLPVPGQSLIKTPVIDRNEDIGGVKNWAPLIRGMQDSPLSRITDPAILAANPKSLVNSEDPNDFDPPSPQDPLSSPDPLTGLKEPSMKNIPSFDYGMHARRDNEFANPAFKGMDVRSTKVLRKSTPETPFSPQSANHEGLMIDQPPSDSIGETTLAGRSQRATRTYNK